MPQQNCIASLVKTVTRSFGKDGHAPLCSQSEAVHDRLESACSQQGVRDKPYRMITFLIWLGCLPFLQNRSDLDLFLPKKLVNLSFVKS